MRVTIAASFLLRDALGVGGLALANAIGVTVEVITLLFILRRRLRTQSLLRLSLRPRSSCQLKNRSSPIRIAALGQNCVASSFFT